MFPSHFSLFIRWVYSVIIVNAVSLSSVARITPLFCIGSVAPLAYLKHFYLFVCKLLLLCFEVVIW